MKTQALPKKIDWTNIDKAIGREAAMHLLQESQHRQRIRRMLIGVTIALTGLMLWLVAGCKTKLDPAGAYHGDTFLFTADRTIVDSKDALSGFLTWEMQNRSQFTNNLREITHIADTIRINAPFWFSNAVIARNAYSNAAALRLSTVSLTSNALVANISQLQAQTLSLRAVTNSVTIK